MVRNEMTLYVSYFFHEDLVDLINQVKKLKSKLVKIHGKDYKKAEEYKTSKVVKKLTKIRIIIKEEVPKRCFHMEYFADPPLPRIFRRVKFNERYRLFFQYNLGSKEVVYLWFNDENTLRSKCSKNDCYNVFNNMVKSNLISTNILANKYIQYIEPLPIFYSPQE